MWRLEGPDEYEIAVCGYTSDLGGKNLWSEWYKVRSRNPKLEPSEIFLLGKMESDFSIGKKQIDLSSSAKGKVKVSAKGKEKVSAKKKEKVKINPPSATAKEEVTIETKQLHPFNVVRMMYQSTQHAFPHLKDVRFASTCRLGCTHLFSLGGLDPVGSDSDGNGAHLFKSERYLKVWSFEVNKPDAGWKAVPPMTFPNRNNPHSVALFESGNLYVSGGFSRSQFPTEVAAKGFGWMEAYEAHDSLSGWKPLPNPPSGFSFNDDPLIFTALDDDERQILVAQYNHDDMVCDSATFYVYDVVNGNWTTLEPRVRKLLAQYPDRTGRRSVAVGDTLYWGLLEDEDFNVQAYDLYKDIWFHGSFNIRPVLGKDEFLADNIFPASTPLLHLANQSFCLFLLTSIYDEKNCEVSNLYLNCLIFNVFPINDEGDNLLRDYYDQVRDDDKEDNANYDVHPHDHSWRLSISMKSIQKYPLANPIQLWDAVFLKVPLSHLSSHRRKTRLRSKLHL